MKKINCRLVLLSIFVALSCVNNVSAEEKVIFPSTKYPDFPFSESVAFGGVLYLSGDLGTGADGKLVEGGIGPETQQVMENRP